jgi:hypothetical protein
MARNGVVGCGLWVGCLVFGVEDDGGKRERGGTRVTTKGMHHCIGTHVLMNIPVAFHLDPAGSHAPFLVFLFG